MGAIIKDEKLNNKRVDELLVAISLLKEVDKIIQHNIPNKKEIEEYNLSEFYDYISDIEMQHSQLVVLIAKSIGHLHSNDIVKSVFF